MRTILRQNRAASGPRAARLPMTRRSP